LSKIKNVFGSWTNYVPKSFQHSVISTERWQDWLFCKLWAVGAVGGLGAVCKCANAGRLKLFFKMCGGKIFKTFRVGLCVCQVKVGLQRKVCPFLSGLLMLALSPYGCS
jgi:hypothetical protein